MRLCEEVRFKVSPVVRNTELNDLFADAWGENYQHRNFTAVLARSMLYVCGYIGNRLVAYVNVAWDGDEHAFLIDTTVRKEFQRQGLGAELVRQAATAASTRGAKWMHVDYEGHLGPFYAQCGFRETKAALLRLGPRMYAAAGRPSE